MAQATALIIDDELQIRRVVRNAIEGDFTRVLEVATGAAGINTAAAERPGLIVLDLGLPDMAGVQVCQEIRQWSAAPILVLSARHSDDEKVTLLDAGADDYLTKPFSTKELQARVRALRRRAAQDKGSDSTIRSGALSIDLLRRRVAKEENELHLTPTEYDLLCTLAKNAGRTMTHQQLFSEVWARPYGDARQHLRVHIANLRRKLEANPLSPQYIVTEPGVGYRFIIV